jgi:hypothetical protein
MEHTDKGGAGMKISVESLMEMRACREGIKYFKSLCGDREVPFEEALLEVAKEYPHYSIWWLTRIFNKRQNVQIAVYSAELVLHIFEEKHPKNNKPKQAIEAAKAWSENPNDFTAYAAYAAARAAFAAAYTAAACVYTAAAYASTAANYAAANAANAANAAANAHNSIIKKGIEILKEAQE